MNIQQMATTLIVIIIAYWALLTSNRTLVVSRSIADLSVFSPLFVFHYEIHRNSKYTYTPLDIKAARLTVLRSVSQIPMVYLSLTQLLRSVSQHSTPRLF